VQGYLADTTQATWQVPDAIAAATLHCIQGGSGLVTTAAPHMYELHSWPMQGSPYSAELHALSTFKPHVWTRQDEHTITTMQLICYSIAQWGSTTLSYAGENQRSWFATSLKTHARSSSGCCNDSTLKPYSGGSISDAHKTLLRHMIHANGTVPRWPRSRWLPISNGLAQFS
jgi:hypothetical protein